jgi:hypothetical protein
MVSISDTGNVNDYYLGDGTSVNRWHQGNDTSKAYFWDITAGPTSVGNTVGDINTTHPYGIPISTISSAILIPPTNIMKYEISQYQYVEFLNSLNRVAQNNQVATDISGTSIADVFVMSATLTMAYTFISLNYSSGSIMNNFEDI